MQQFDISVATFMTSELSTYETEANSLAYDL